MKGFLFFIGTVLLLFCCFIRAGAQTSQTVVSGSATAAITFPAACNYKWVNDKPGIGLAASGTGNIGSFVATNNGNTPIVATIKAAPVGFSYIANQTNPGTVSVYDNASNDLVTTIPVGTNPNAIAASADGTRVYVANAGSKNISVINTATNTVAATITVGNAPAGLAVSPDGSRLYVTNYLSASVSVINTASNAVLFGIALPVNDQPIGIAVSADGTKIYVADNGPGTVSVIDAATQIKTALINIGSGSSFPWGITVSPDGNRVYVTNTISDDVSVIDATTNLVIATIQAGSQPNGVVVSPDGSRIYSANASGGSVSVIDAGTNTLITNITVGASVTGVSVSPDGSLLYATDPVDHSVSAISTATNTVLTTISLPPGSNPSSFGNFISTGASCPVQTYTITVNPPLPTIAPGAVTGRIAGCAGNVSASPNIQQIKVSGTLLTSGITATAPAGFEVSLTAGGGYGNSVTLAQSGGVVNNETIYVRSAASATGNISGMVSLTSAGATNQNVAVTGVITPLADVNAVPNQVYNNGDVTTPIVFTGTANTFTWTIDNWNIGAPTGGSVSMPSFTAFNNGNAPVVATVTVTPIKAPILYIVNSQNNTVSVINTSTNVVSTISTGPATSALGVSVSPDGSKVYITENGTQKLAVVNAATNQITNLIDIGDAPDEVAISPDGTRAYVTNGLSDNVSVINTGSNTVVATVNVGSYPFGVAVSPDGSRVYVANSHSASVSVINTASNVVTATIAVGSNPMGLTITPDGSQVYVANQNSNTVSDINTSTNSVTNITVGLYPQTVAVSPDGSRAYVSNYSAGTISVINTATNAVISTFATGQYPTSLAVSPDGNWLYAASSGAKTVSKISTATYAVQTTFPVGEGAWGLGNIITSDFGCPGTPITFKITVNPSAPVINFTPATGSIFVCAGAASASPYIQGFTVSGLHLTASLQLAAPAGFEISLSAASGYGTSLTIAQSGGSTGANNIYVRSAASAIGNISGNVVLTSTGATSQNVAVSADVNALPTVNPVTSQEVFTGTPIIAVNFSGTGDTFSWTNDMPGIGLAATGKGNIASFTAVNSGSSQVTANIIVTPAFSPYAYVANENSGTVSVINTATNVIKTVITVGTNPLGVTASPDGSRVYVVNNGSNSVSVINTATNTVITEIPVQSFPGGIAISADGSRLYVANENSNTVSVINTGTNALITNVTVGTTPYGIAVNSTGTRVYVTNQGSSDVSVINTATNVAFTTIASGSFPVGVVVSPDATRVYVANQNSNNITVINASTNTALAPIVVGNQPAGIAISPDGSLLYVSNATAGNVSVINTATQAIVGTVTVGTTPYGVSVTSDGSFVYVTNVGSNNVSVINTATGTVIATVTLPAGSNPYSFGIFISKGISCGGVPVTFTIKVDAAPPVINATIATGSVSACAGVPSVSPNIQQFTVSGSNLGADIIATAPTGFEVSLTSGSGYGSSVTLTQSGGTVNSTLVYVRSSASAASGNISGNVILTSAGVTSQNVSVAGTVSALPTVNAVADQTVTNGNPTTTVNFTGTANTFLWTNDTPSIGLAANGTGNITSFNAVNTGSSPVKATIVATPVAAPYAYISNYIDNTVSVINTATHAIVSIIPVGAGPNGTTSSRDGSRIFVANEGGGTVSVINTVTNTVISTITVGINPLGISVSPDGSTLYVSRSGPNTLEVINISTGVITATVNVGISPAAVAVSPDGSRIYVTNYASNNITVIDAATNLVTATIAAGTLPNDILISPDGATAYVANGGSNDVSVINTSINLVTSSISVGTNALGLALSPDGSRLYVSNYSSNSISVINTVTKAVVTTITVGSAPDGISVTADGSLVFVGNTGSNDVTVIDAASNAVLTTINVGRDPGTSFGNFITGGVSCSGPPVTFTITVNAAAPVITANTPTGIISACEGTASASPNIQQFTVSGSNLTGDITAAAPTGFEVSVAAASGYGSNVTLTQTGGTVSNALVYVRSAASASGDIAGDVTLSSTGADPQNVAVMGTVSALPTVNAVTDQVVNNGSPTTAVTFTGTGNTFTWTNDTPGIGLAANGTGDITSFTAVNTGTSPVTATVTVTPMSRGLAYITNSGDGTVSVVSAASGTILGVIPVGTAPYGVATTPDGNNIYVTNSGSNNVSVISTVTNSLVTIIPVGDGPYGVAISPDGSLVYVANQRSNTLSVIKVATNAVIATITVGTTPFGMALTPDGSTLYVTNFQSGNLSIINTATNTVTSTISVGLNPAGIFLSHDGSQLYIADPQLNIVTVLNTATNAVITTIPADQGPETMVASPDGSRLYVANLRSYTVSVINTATNTVVTTIAVGQLPIGISISQDGKSVYTTNLNDNSISVISTATNTVTSTIKGFSAPTAPGISMGAGVSCSGAPVTFTIKVNPTPPTITATGTLSALTTTYGTPSPSTSFSVSGINMTAGILVTAPIGFEVSTDNINFSPTVTVGAAGTIASTAVYVRLSSTIPVGSYSGNVVLSSSGAISVNVPTVNSTVTPAPLGITANNANKTYGTTLTGGSGSTAFTVTGLQNSETIGSVTIAYGTGSAATDGVGTYTGSVIASAATGGTFTAGNYTITYVPGDIIVGAVPLTITTTLTAGTITACVGTASASPNIQQFTVSGNNLTGDVTATAPTGFEVSLAWGSGYGSSVVLIQSGGALSNTLVYVRSASTAASGNISGNVVLSSPGATSQNVVVTGTVNALPVVNTIANQIVNNGNPTTAVSFTGTGNTYTWVNDTPGIGLAGSGTGNIASFTAVNTGVTPVTATVTATPVPAGFAYIANDGDNTVSVINTTTNAVVSTITIPGVPVGQTSLPPAPFGVSASADGSRVYVANNFGSVSVINTATNTVDASITIPDSTLNGQLLFPSPNGIAVSPKGDRLYVVNYNQQSLSIINTLTNTIIATLSLEANGFALGGISVSADGSRVYVANSDFASVSVINAVTYKIIATIAVGGQPVGTVLSPDGTKLYVVSQKQVWIINTATNSVISNISTGVDVGNRGVAISPDGSKLYVTNIVDNAVAVVSTTTNAVLTTIPVGNTPYGVSLNADGSLLFVANNGSNTVSVINTTTNAVTSTINVGNTPYSFGNFISVGAGCSGAPVKFTITVNPTVPTITTGGGLSALTTTYGTASASTSFTVSGTNITAGILVTAPTGFEVSTDNINFSSTVTVGTVGTIASTIVYIRLPSTISVGSYSGNIVLSSAGAANVNLPTVNSMVTPAPLIITANTVNKSYGTTLTGGPGSTAFTVTGLQNSETIGGVTIGYGAGSAAADGAGTYTGSVTASAAAGGTFAAGNYTITYVPGDIVVGTVPLTITANTVNKTYGALLTGGTGLTAFTVTGIQNSETIGSITIAYGAGSAATDGVGTYTGSVTASAATGGTFTAGNYTITYVSGDIIVGTVPLTITANTVNKTYGALLTGGSGSTAFTVTGLQNSETIGSVTIAYGAGSAAADGVGIYTGSVSASAATGGTFIAGNYTITYAPGDIIVNAVADPPSITTTQTTGKITACAGSASANPNLLQFTFSGSNLTAGVTATAPAGFEVSLSAGSGYAGNIVIPQSGGTVNSTVVYVHSSASAPAGNLIAKVSLTSPGANGPNVAVGATINALPTVNAVSNQTVNNGNATAAVNFTGTGNTFTWVNDTPGIGLASSGTGNIASFTAVNSGSAPVKATITATATSSSFAYIPNLADNTMSVIDIQTNKVIATISAGDGPWGVAPSPDGSRIYVTTANSNAVSVINTATNKIIASIRVGLLPQGIAITPDGKYVYVVNFNSSSISVISTANNTIVATIAVGDQPIGVLISPDGTRAYVTNGGSDDVSVINTSTNTVIATIAAGRGPEGLAIAPDGTRLYVVNQGGQTVTVMDVTNNTVITAIAVGTWPLGAAISPNGKQVYVPNAGDNTVSVINTATNTVVSAIPVGSNPEFVSITADGAWAYVTNEGSNTVSVINTATNAVLTNIDVGAGAIGFGNFITQGTGCTGLPITFTITVNPTAVLPTITASPPTGTITACAGTSSVSPHVQQFTVSGNGLSGDIIVAAPNNFEISLSPSNGYSSSLPLTQLGGAVNPTIIYVRSLASAPAGNISGNVTLSSTGLPDEKVPVTGTINALPTVNAIASQTLATGATTKAIAFTGTGVAYNWTNDTPSIGLAASGGGDIPTFTAINNTGSTVTATVTATPSTPALAYVPNQNGSSVSVIDLSSNQAIKSIPVGVHPFGVSVSPDGSVVYIANTSSNDVSVINTTTNTVTATIPVGNSPGGLTVSPDGSRVYVACLDANSTATIWVIDTKTNTTLSTLSACNGPAFIAVGRDGSRIYVTCSYSNAVLVVDTQTNAVIATVPVGTNPQFIAISPDGTLVYAINFQSNNVSVINTATNTVTATIPVGVGPLGVQFSADGSQAYVADYTSNDISVINTATNAVTTTITGLLTPEGLSLNAEGTRLYAADQTANEVAVIDVSTNTVLARVDVGFFPGAAGNFIAPGLSCTGTPVTFTITVTSTANPTITTTGAPAAVTTIYGTPSASSSFTVSGSNTTAGILVTPPVGFEVSTDNITFTSTVTIGAAGTTAPTTVYIRLGQTTGAGIYTGNIVLSSGTAAKVNVVMPASTVTPAALTITANNKSKTYGTALAGGGKGSSAFTVTALQNSESIGTVTITYGKGALAGDAPGAYTGSVIPSAATGGRFTPANYTITYLPGDIIVAPAPLTIIADNKTKIYGDPNPVLTVGYIGFVNSDGPSQLTTAPVITTTAVMGSPVGQYPITVSGAASPNYTITYLPGVLTVELVPLTIVIPNTFTPNGDGINDTWNIKNIDFYTNCTVDVFTRWGQKVYSSIGYGTAWGGTYNNTVLPTGTYYYLIDLKNGSKLLSGFVAIVR